MVDADASIDVDMLAHELVEGVDDAQSERKIVASAANGAQRAVHPQSTSMQFDVSLSPSNGVPSIPFSALGEVLQEKTVRRTGLAVIVPPARNHWEYKVFQEDDEVDEILEEYDDAGFLEYLVLFADGSEDVVSAVPKPTYPSTRTSHRRSLCSIASTSFFYLCPSTHSSICHPNT